MDTPRAQAVRQGVRLEVFTVAWMVLEAVVSIGAGLLAGSALLTAFGIDSLIELASGAILLWRLLVEERGGDPERVEHTERRATWVVAIALGLLCLYVVGTAAYGLVTRSQPEASPLGIAVSAAAVLVMPWLAFQKKRVAQAIDSSALQGDAASSITCGYMAATVLVGLLLEGLFHWGGPRNWRHWCSSSGLSVKRGKRSRKPVKAKPRPTRMARPLCLVVLVYRILVAGWRARTS